MFVVRDIMQARRARTSTDDLEPRGSRVAGCRASKVPSDCKRTDVRQTRPWDTTQ
jgi:hypothetical protein